MVGLLLFYPSFFPIFFMATPADSGAGCSTGSSCNKCPVCKLACLLVLIGGVNWGLIGIGGFISKDLNVVHMILGGMPALEWIVYILVGVAAVMKAANCCKCCKK
jgi:uncharacterized membrane protein YuzA (DUF378 family)